MAVDMFMKLDPVKGESQDDKFKDQIEVLSWSWGITQPANMHTGTGGGTAKLTVQDLTFTHGVDRASPDLIKYCTTGKHFQSAVLVCRKAGGDAMTYLTIELDQVMITNVRDGCQGETLTQSVTLTFRKFNYGYTQQTRVGTGGTTMKWGHDITSNAEWGGGAR
jgi:type VI secretion system secreted protein Hcp